MSSDLRSMRRVIGVLAAVAAMGTVGLLAPALADTKSDLEAVRTKLSALSDRIGAEAATVARLQDEASAVAGRINAIQVRIAETATRAATVRQQIRDAERRLRGLQSRLDGRARAAYENGPGSSLELLLGSTSLAEFADRLEFVGRAEQSDHDLVIQVQNHKADLARKQADVRRLQSDLSASRDDLLVQQSALQTKLASAADALAALRSDQAEAEALVEKLADQREREIEAARLAAAAAAAAADRAPHLHASAAGGGGDVGAPFSVCPVDQPRGYGDDFGAPRWGGGYHTHQGNDIFAPLGTPIRAPFPGTAQDASNSLGGISVKVFGSGGFVYNAHMSRMGALGGVSAGTVIGYVGNSGDAQGTATHDHFEWHPGNGGAVNPYPYLNQVC